jgi:hypothetical protein
VRISLCCLCSADPARLAALLELLRDRVDEIVVAVDDRADTAALGPVRERADRVVLVPYAPPPGRMLPWLYAQCTGDWVLRLDDDEVPSRALLDGLRSLADPSVTHVWLPRRWLYGGEDTYLDAWPWVPDFQLRLSVNDPRLVRFPAVRHIPVEVAGPARYASEPIYHLDLLRPRAERERKVADYDRERPGMRIAGLAFNQAFYLPELSEAPLGHLPAEDRELVTRVTTAAPEPVATPADLPRATREEIDAHWSGRAPEYAVELDVLSAPARLGAGERAPVVLTVHNHGASDLSPEAVQVGSRWDEGEPGLWSPLPATVTAGNEAVVPATVEAPGTPGRHILELDLVHEGVRWFEAPVRVEIEVARRRRVGILVREATRSRGPALAEAVIAAAPSLEPVLVGAADGGGWATTPGPEQQIVSGLAAGRRRLRSFAEAGRRVRALRREPDVLEVDALVLAGLEATTLLEPWTDLAAALLAADRQAPILVPPTPPARGLLDRLLLRRLVRTRGVQVGGGEALSGFLTRL